MTTGTNPKASGGVQQRAAEILGVDASASSREARRAYFRKIRECDFLPPRALQHALGIIEGRPGPADLIEQWLREDESRLHDDLEAFAEKFFALPAAQRRARWEELTSVCKLVSPHLTARLQGLKAGLEVDPRHFANDPSPHGRLADHMLQAFPLRPLARAASRQAFLRHIEECSDSNHKSWERAARYLLEEWPALAALDRELVQDVAQLRRRLRLRRKMHRLNHSRRATAPASRGSWWLVLALSGTVAILRALTGLHHSSSSQPPSSSYSAPFDRRDPNNLPIGHTAADQLASWRQLGARSPYELLDSSKFDVAIVQPRSARLLSFKPRPGSAMSARDDPPVNWTQPFVVGEVTLRLWGISAEQIDALFLRATAGQLAGSTPKKLPGPARPTQPQSIRRDKSRP